MKDLLIQMLDTSKDKRPNLKEVQLKILAIKWVEQSMMQSKQEIVKLSPGKINDLKQVQQQIQPIKSVELDNQKMSQKSDQNILKSSSGAYLIEQKISRGAFGSVYQVIKLEGKQKYALKIQFDICDREKKFIDLLINNYQQLQGFPRIYEQFKTGGKWYIVQQFCQGGDLRKKLEEREKKNIRPYFQKMEIYNIIQDVVEALIQLDSVKLYHRNITLENILIFEDPQNKNTKYKLCSFGLVKDVQDKHLTRRVGTLAYSAYEIVKDLPYDNKCDIWSLGAVIYELFNGIKLFDGDEEEAEQQIKGTNNSKLKDKINDLELDLSMRDLLVQMLDTRAEKRPNLKQVQQKIQEIKRVELELQKMSETFPEANA